MIPQHVLSVAAAVLLTGLMNLHAATQLDAEATLARAEAAYYEARFSDTVAMLAPLNATLESQPGRVPELVRTKLQLALAYIGLNQLSQAKTMFLELREADPQFSLDPTKFAQKVIALFDEAGAARDERKCEICDSIFEEAVEAYNRGELPEALAKIQSVLALNPQHQLAAEYLVVIENRLKLSIEQLALDWKAAADLAKSSPTTANPVAAVTQSEAGLTNGCMENASSVALIRLKSRIEPRLPAELRHKRNLRVQVTVRIDEKGNTRVYQVRGGSMPVTKAVIAAVDQWKFYPATYNDQPACIETELPVVVSR